ncbi:MAG TPA: phosphoketolase family protein [Candidatus Paceibacterota bacterium]|nr:phosphoketolase family protein [Candidatus Paceibacterota bacterium]
MRARKINYIEAIKKHVRAANYITAAQIYLQDNFLLSEPLKSEHIKPRLLGHWGTCPGINFVYANLNHLIKQTGANIMFLLGPGHGFPALQANLFIEGTLSKYFPEATRDEKGLAYIAKQFSWPYGFPSHSNPTTPGVILEGGELGYALSTAYGAVLDNPDLIAACLVGDGEAETGPTATAWHLNKLVDPATNGVVLPILHLNGYKISGPTLFGRMSNKQLLSLFRGYGYRPIIVEGEDDHVYKKMADALAKAYRMIGTLKKKAAKGDKFDSLPFPMIILRTPKGWTGIKELHGEKMEGNALSHQVVGHNAKTDKTELSAIEEWMRSYNFSELFDAQKGFVSELDNVTPDAEHRMGDNKNAFPARVMKNLVLPDIKKIDDDKEKFGEEGKGSMARAGQFMKEVFLLNKENNNFRVFSPDETYSNRIDEVFKAVKRAFLLPNKPWDKDYGRDGKVVEMLSEHTLQGLMQGYVLTGRHGFFVSYEAFIQIVGSMADQYAKFLKVARSVPWRGDVPSFNYILTSTGWRQDHNGFSHQNPGFISEMLQKHGSFVRAYFPPDESSMLAVMKECAGSKNQINIIVAGKTPEPQWLSLHDAEKSVKEGMMIWEHVSEENPDIVFAGIGDYLTKETIAAIKLLKNVAPEIKSRFVNILELSTFGFGNADRKMSADDFEKYFTEDKPIIFNFHGYPEVIQSMLFHHGDSSRFSVHGYIENGSTTTPFDMHIRNKTSRYHLAIDALQKMSAAGVIDNKKAESIIKDINKNIEDHREYILKNGIDPVGKFE